MLPTPSWRASLEFLRLSHVWSLPIRKGSKTVDSIPARRLRNGQPTLLRANKWSQDDPQLSHQLLCHCGVSCANHLVFANLPSLPSGLAHESVKHCAAQDLPTREAMKRCLSLSVPVWGRFAGCCRNTARCPDHVLPRILLCWLDPRFGAGSWHELRHNAGAAAKHFGDPSRAGCGQATFGVLPQSPGDAEQHSGDVPMGSRAL